MASVKIYSTPACPYCKGLKAYLTEKGIAFEDIDVSTDKAKAKEAIEISGQMGVPVLVVNEKKVIVGFDKEEINKALKA